MIKRFICVACLCFLGCCEATNQPEAPKWVPAFKVGDLIKIRVSDVKGHSQSFLGSGIGMKYLASRRQWPE
jgi:hypothetical protein